MWGRTSLLHRLQIAFEQFSFIKVFLIICESLLCFTDKVADSYAKRTYIFLIWNCIRIKGEVTRG